MTMHVEHSADRRWQLLTTNKALISGNRFHENARSHFKLEQMPADLTSRAFIDDVLLEQIKSHRNEQVPSLEAKFRAYENDGNIHYRESKNDPFAADNRISTPDAERVITFEVGYTLGKDVQFQNEHEDAAEYIKDFLKVNAANKVFRELATDVGIFGRGYALNYVQNRYNGSIAVRVTTLSPIQTFVVYDYSRERNSLYAVNYYEIDKSQRIEVYTSTALLEYAERDDGVVSLDKVTPHIFGAVPITEVENDAQRMGSFERVLDLIDAKAIILSDIVNTWQDFADAMLVMSGVTRADLDAEDEPDFLEDGRINPKGAFNLLLQMRQARLLQLFTERDDDGNLLAAPTASYLTKTYDANGFTALMDRIDDEIALGTYTPRGNDRDMSSAQTGEAMKQKRIGIDAKRKRQEENIRRGIERMLQLASNIWTLQSGGRVNYEVINNTTITIPELDSQFTNDEVSPVLLLADHVSKRTLLENLAQYTGIDVDDELARMKEEASPTTD